MRAPVSAESLLTAWAASGALSLCGQADGPPLDPPARLLEVLATLGASIAERSGSLGRTVQLDPFAVCTERAAISGLRRQGRISCGGASRLLPTTDGWLAVTLARPDDLELLPAWLGSDRQPDPEDPWSAVEQVAARQSADRLATDGAFLGLPVAVVGSVTRAHGPPVVLTHVGDAPTRPLEGRTVVDLSALWAGPLCTRILADSGARVIKVESTTRPDGARRGPMEFFDLMNAGKESVAIDLASAPGRDALENLLRHADVVVESSRPRALRALGIDAHRVTATGPTVWLSITGHGRTGEAAHRVGFGDDTAAAGGAVVTDGSGPCFCADALGDPAAGLTAALAVLDACSRGGRWLIDVALSRVAAGLAGPSINSSHVDAAPPSPPASRGQAAPMGAHTDAVLGSIW